MNVAKADEAFYIPEYRVRRWLEEGTVRVFGATWTLEPEVRFSGPEDVQRYVDKVLAHIGCERPIRVRARRGNRFAHYEPGGVIAIPRREIGGEWALREIVVLHEIAHHLARGDSGHGALFVRTFIDLLADVGHTVTSRLLEIACYEEGTPL